MAVLDSVLVAIVSFVVGTVGIVVGARLVLDRETGARYAAVTALLGAVAWGITSFFTSWIPVLGVAVMLVVWVGVINYRYPGGWVSAAGIGAVAWVAAVVVIYLLSAVGFVTPDVFGIPGV